jgi:hypothetical protein
MTTDDTRPPRTPAWAAFHEAMDDAERARSRPLPCYVCGAPTTGWVDEDGTHRDMVYLDPMTTGLRTRAAKRRLEWAPSHDDHCRFRVSRGSDQCNCGLEEDLRMVEEEERARYAALVEMARDLSRVGDVYFSEDQLLATVPAYKMLALRKALDEMEVL